MHSTDKKQTVPDTVSFDAKAQACCMPPREEMELNVCENKIQNSPAAQGGTWPGGQDTSAWD